MNVWVMINDGSGTRSNVVMTDDSGHGEESDGSLSSHTISLRKAYQDCSNEMERLRKSCDGPSGYAFSKNMLSLARDAWAAAERYRDQRIDGINELCQKLSVSNDIVSLPVDVVNVDRSSACCLEGKNSTSLSPCEFKQRYHARNVPCIIRGLGESNFSYISSQWRKNDCVDTEWFRKFVGDDTKVPVRIEPTNTAIVNQDNGLDDEGRATECDTVEIKLCEWIQYCQTTSEQGQLEMCPLMKIGTAGYLKDWHLLQFLGKEQSQDTNHHLLHSSTSWLYSVPSIFERDLLNNFLTHYTRGDYKFVYWGPKGSRTNLHSDVMHSFSWSYNVVGKKHWTFYIPRSNGDGETNEDKAFQLIQETGETIFVPAKWKHEVENLSETLSVNHNWITAANIDCTFECLLTEIASIEQEIKEWGIIFDDDYEARENMLRGCVGIDISMLVMMVLSELVELFNTAISRDKNLSNSSAREQDITWDVLYSIFRLRNVLQDVLLGRQDKNVNVAQRLSATLYSEEFARDVILFSNFYLESCNTLIER